MVMRLNKGQIIRKKVVASAIRVFSKRGFSHASIREIASGAGIKPTALLHHFESKDAILVSALDDVLARFQERLQGLLLPSDSAGVRLRKNFHANLAWVRDQPADASLLLFLYYSATHEKSYRALYSKILTAVRVRYTELIYAGIREGEFKTDLEPEEVAELIHEVVLGSMINFVSSSQRENEESILIRKWDRFVKSVLGWTLDQ